MIRDGELDLATLRDRCSFALLRMIGLLVMNPPNENVLVIRRSLFDELGSFPRTQLRAAEISRRDSIARKQFFSSASRKPKSIPPTSKSFRTR